MDLRGAAISDVSRLVAFVTGAFVTLPRKAFSHHHHHLLLHQLSSTHVSFTTISRGSASHTLHVGLPYVLFQRAKYPG